MKKYCKIIRGVPGTGKTTLAKTYEAIGYVHCEADHYFEVDGEYCFDHTKIKNAHSQCKKAFHDAIKKGLNVVSNTFTRTWEYQFYQELAEEEGYDVEIISLTHSRIWFDPWCS